MAKGYRSYRVLCVWTDGVPGDTCPKRGGQPLKLGDGQCSGEKRCQYFVGLGPFVTIRCAHPSAPLMKPKEEVNDASDNLSK